MTNNFNTYSWTYGYYVDNISNKKISNENIVKYKQLNKNRVLFSNTTDIVDRPIGIGIANGDFNSLDILDSLRQYISIPFSPSVNIDQIEFNSNIFLDMFVNNGFLTTNLDESENPYIEIKSSSGSIKFSITKCQVLNDSIASLVLTDTIYNVTEIKFYGARAYKSSVFGPSIKQIDDSSFSLTKPSDSNRNQINFIENIFTDFINYTRSRNSVFNTNDTEYQPIPVLFENSIFSKPLSSKTYGNLYGYLEFLTTDSITFDTTSFNYTTINSNIYFFSPNEQLTPLKDPRLVSGGVYLNSQQDKSLKQRCLFPFAKKWNSYLNSLSDQWINDCLILSKNLPITVPVDSNYFNLDDFESLDIYRSNPVTLTYLNIQIETDGATPTPTPTPSYTATPTVTQTPTLTPSFSEAMVKIGHVYIWGQNKYQDETITTPNKIEQDDTFLGIKLSFSNIFTGTNHCIASRQDKILFPFKDNRYSQLGLPLSDTTLQLNKLNTIISTINSRWKNVSIGDDFTYLLNIDNEIYRWGKNTYQQMGSNFDILPLPSQLVVDGNTKFLDVSCGNDHVFIISQNGELYVCGTLDGFVLNNFVKYSEDTNWLKVFSNDTNTFGIKSNDSSLYLIRGLLNNGLNLSFNSSPISIDSNISNYKSIDVGDSHLLLIKEDGSLWGYGDNTYNQLGIDSANIINDHSLTLIDGSLKWSKVAAGSRHSLAINSIGVLYGWGYGQDYQFGFKQNNFDRPILIWGGDWIDISAKGNLNAGISRTDISQLLATATPTQTPTNSRTPTPTPTISTTPPQTPPPPSPSPSPTHTSTNTPTVSRTPTTTPTPTQTRPIFLFQIIQPDPTPTISSSNAPTRTPTPTPTIPPVKPYDFTNIAFVI
jgi:alpha-tubulin suppressor-like RCC1 family protein